MTKEEQETKGHLFEHCRKYAIEIAKRVEEAAKFFQTTIKIILRDRTLY
jgi:hypothetical protein